MKKHWKAFVSAIIASIGIIVFFVAGAELIARDYGYGFLPVSNPEIFVVVGLALIGPFLYYGGQHADAIVEEMDKLAAEGKEKRRKLNVLWDIISGKYGPRRQK